MTIKIDIFCLLIFANAIFAQDIDLRISKSSAAQFSPQVSSDSLGNRVIVWTDYRNSKGIYGGKGSDGDIYGQRVSYNGQLLGDNFRISDDSTNTDLSYAGQIFPRISMNNKGSFIVTWIDTRPRGSYSDSYDFNIFAQSFDSFGNLLDKNIMVNNDTSGAQLDPDVAIRDDASFIIVWEDVSDQKSTYLQAFDPQGNPIGSNQKLNLTGEHPRIAFLKNGNYVVLVGNTAQVFSWPFQKVGDSFSIPYGFEREVKTDQDNNIILAYVAEQILPGKISDFDVFIQKFDETGKSLTENIKINDDNTHYWQAYPSLAVTINKILVTWDDFRNGRQFGAGGCRDVYAQRLDANLNKIGANFKVSHENNSSSQMNPSCTLIKDSLFVVWIDGRSKEFYNIYPPQVKLDIWATVQNFNSPIEGKVIPCDLPPAVIINQLKLFQSYPNPTNMECTFVYDLPEEAHVQLKLFNILGQEVKTLISEHQDSGHYIRSFPYLELGSGVYFARITAEGSNGITVTGTVKVNIIK